MNASGNVSCLDCGDCIGVALAVGLILHAARRPIFSLIHRTTAPEGQRIRAWVAWSAQSAQRELTTGRTV
jgi:hypothetical protein